MACCGSCSAPSRRGAGNPIGAIRVGPPAPRPEALGWPDRAGWLFNALCPAAAGAIEALLPGPGLRKDGGVARLSRPAGFTVSHRGPCRNPGRPVPLQPGGAAAAARPRGRLPGPSDRRGRSRSPACKVAKCKSKGEKSKSSEPIHSESSQSVLFRDTHLLSDSPFRMVSVPKLSVLKCYPFVSIPFEGTWVAS